MPKPPRRRIAIRLIHDGAQPGPPLPETLHFGLQDTKADIHPGTPGPDGTRIFDFALDVADDTAGNPVFRGAFAHGPPKGRFLYLSWKREGVHEHAFGWRIKMPLTSVPPDLICAAEQPGMCLAANVIGRRPHASQPVTWQVQPL
jgi:hypothetical protein